MRNFNSREKGISFMTRKENEHLTHELEKFSLHESK
jgi:hypothetical protein